MAVTRSNIMAEKYIPFPGGETVRFFEVHHRVVNEGNHDLVDTGLIDWNREWREQRVKAETWRVRKVWAIGKGEGEEEEEEKKSALFLNVGKFETKNETNEGDVVRMKDEIKICIHYPFSFPFLFLFFWKNYPLWNPVVLSFTRGTRGRIDCFI